MDEQGGIGACVRVGLGGLPALIGPVSKDLNKAKLEFLAEYLRSGDVIGQQPRNAGGVRPPNAPDPKLMK